MTKARHIPPRRSGFTLIEAIAAMTVISVLGSLAGFVLVSAIDGYTRASTGGQLHAELSTALDRIERELRNITLQDGLAQIAPEITDVTATSIEWSTDSSLTFAAGTLTLAPGGLAPAAAILNNVTAFAVQTYDESDNALAAVLTGADCYPIRRIAFTVTVQRHGVSASLRSNMFVRCTMEGGGV